jgi:probable F420-dependent oxidoreductase
MTTSVSRLAVSLGLWQDRPPGEAMITARAADELGFTELWIGEMATYDVFALATAVGLQTANLRITVGPLPVHVRDPMMIAMGAASVVSLTGRQVGVAIGASSPVVVSQWHGRDRSRPLQAMLDSVRVLRALLDGGKADGLGEVMTSRGYRLRLDAPPASVSMAAFGPAAVRSAAAHGDRMVVSLVTAGAAADLAKQCAAAAEEIDRPTPPVVAWVPVGVGESRPMYEQVRAMLVGYLGAPGYAEMFAGAGFAEVVDFAHTRPHPGELLARIPDALIDEVAAIGELPTVKARLDDYLTGVDGVVMLPCSTDSDPGGARTLQAIAEAYGMYDSA